MRVPLPLAGALLVLTGVPVAPPTTWPVPGGTAGSLSELALRSVAAHISGLE